MGGEKTEPSGPADGTLGSPPRGRGKDFMFCGQHLEIRITPAWAGKSVLRRPRWTHTGDHPRVGGEKGFPTFWSRKNSGSPPHGRGKVQGFMGVAVVPGITPAWAGKSGNLPPLEVMPMDHPHMGGEKVQILLYEDIQKGSPPRWRGKVPHSLGQGHQVRITPA